MFRKLTSFLFKEEEIILDEQEHTLEEVTIKPLKPMREQLEKPAVGKLALVCSRPLGCVIAKPNLFFPFPTSPATCLYCRRGPLLLSNDRYPDSFPYDKVHFANPL